MPSGETYIKLASQILSSSTQIVTFSNIPQAYTDLVLVANGGMATTTGYALALRFNNISSSQYSSTYILGNGSTVSYGRYSPLAGAMYLGGPALNTLNGNFMLHIFNYSNSSTFKSVIARTNRGGTDTWAVAGTWQNSAAINRIDISPEFVANWLAGSTFTLYGIAANDALPGPKATGGIITSDATYFYHTFLSTGQFIPSTSLSARALVVSGGGGGGSNVGGGGGGGPVLEDDVMLSSGTYVVTVGGSGSTSTTGIPSSFVGPGINISLEGGGAGSSVTGGNAGTGGGAGAASSSASGGLGSWGGNGGNSSYGTSTFRAAGGGGGDGGNGSNGFRQTIPGFANIANGGDGGVGTSSSILGSTIFYGGGGGGGAFVTTTPNPSSYPGAGGSGGGGSGGNFGTGQSGIINTGGGGGGGGNASVGGTGGSGIVIVRYPRNA